MFRRRTILGVVALAALAAGCAQFQVTKQVTPTGASTGPFNVVIDCEPTEDMLAEPEPEQEGEGAGAAAETEPLPLEVQPQLVIDELVFNGDGTQFSDTFPDQSTCIITEPVTAGALSVTFACTGVLPPEAAAAITCTPIANGLQVVIGDTGADPLDPVTIQVLVTNAFADPASTVVAAPNFTG